VTSSMIHSTAFWEASRTMRLRRGETKEKQAMAAVNRANPTPAEALLWEDLEPLAARFKRNTARPHPWKMSWRQDSGSLFP
jgi:hypothetical protein